MNRRVVYKYEIQLGEQELMLPVGSEILHVGFDGRLQLWALVDPLTANMIAHTLIVIGTGRTMDDLNLRHLGTIQTPECVGEFVWHVFKVLPR